MTSVKLWSLDTREYDALVLVRQDHMEWQTGLVASIRADIHNNGMRDWGRVFEPGDFMPGANEEIEQKIAELVAQGWPPAAAAAAVTSKQPKEHQLHLIDSMKPAKKKGGRKRA